MKRRQVLIPLAVATAAVLAATPAVATPASLNTAPYAMDDSNLAGWWTPLETYIDGTTEHAYLAFNKPVSGVAAKHHVSVAERISASGTVTWVEHRLLDGGVAAQFDDDLGHAQPSVARDGNGDLHVFAGMHTDPWQYYRSNGSGDLENESADIPDSGVKVTYPVVATAPNGDVYLAARVDRLNPTTGAVTDRPGRLYHWDVSAQTWYALGAFAEESGYAVYPDDIQVDANGDVHLLYSWSRFPSSGYRHELSYLVYDVSASAFVDSTGASVTAPATRATSDVIQTMETGETYVDDDHGVQTGKLALDGTDPKVAYRYRSASSGTVFEILHAETTGSGWADTTVYSASGTRATIDITWHPTEGSRVYYVVNSGANRVFAATQSGGAWTSHSIADGLPIERIAVERSGSKDILYLVDVVNLDLIYGRH